MLRKKRSADKKIILLPLIAQDLTITTFFATQQLLTNLSNTQDPNLLLSDIAEALHTTPQALTHLPIGSWDDNILRAILESSDSVNSIRENTSETKTDSDLQTSQSSESFNAESIETETFPSNSIQTIDTEAPEFKDEITLLGIARHLSNLVSELSSLAKEHTKNQRTFKPTGKKEIATPRTVEQMLPECLWFIHKGHKYFLLGRDADCCSGFIPHNKMTVGEFVTLKAVELNAHANAPKRDSDGNIHIEREILAPNGKPTGKVLTDEEYKAKMMQAILQDIDIAFNLSLRQVAVLCRRAHEALPQETAEREQFITERALTFQDVPAWIAFAIRGFFLERLLARQLTRVGSLISQGGELRQA